MRSDLVVGITLIAGLITFLVGAGGWRPAYDKPLEEALRTGLLGVMLLLSS